MKSASRSRENARGYGRNSIRRKRLAKYAKELTLVIALSKALNISRQEAKIKMRLAPSLQEIRAANAAMDRSEITANELQVD